MKGSKIVPLCVAGRLPLPPFLYIVLFLLLLAQNVSPLPVYDRLTLLNIDQSVGKLPIHVAAAFAGVYTTLPTGPLGCSRRRRRGRRGGVLRRLRAFLASPSTDSPRRSLSELSKGYVGYDVRGSAHYCYRWLLPALPEAGYPLPCRRPIDRCLIRSAPINTRSVANKTFILNDFFYFLFPGFAEGNPD